jgi:hypothetical protein
VTTPSRPRTAAVRHLTTPSLRLALGLAEMLMPRQTYDGDPAVDPRDARYLLSGQLGIWDRWRNDLTTEHLTAIDQLIAWRPRRLATEGGFRISFNAHMRNNRSPRYEPLGDLLRVRDGIAISDLIAQALAELQRGATAMPVPPQAQPGGNYSSSLFLPGTNRDEFRRNTYQIPDVATEDQPITLIPAPTPQQLKVDFDALRTTAIRIDKARAGTDTFSLAASLDSFRLHLRNPQGQPASTLNVTAGPLQMLIAPTGSGKSVLTRVAATQWADAGHTVLLLTPNVESTLELVADIRSDLQALGLDYGVAALMSSRRLIEIAEHRSDDAPDDQARARWTWNEIGYSCLLPNEEGTPWQPGQEPCTDLQAIGEDGRHRCPFINVCEKWEPWRQAAGPAKIIVTNHAYFQQGSVPIPTVVDGTTHGRLSAQRFLLQRAGIVVIDEVDAFQAHAVALSGRTLVLASREAQDLLLAKLDIQRKEQVHSGHVPADLELDFQRSINRLNFLSERYLSAVVNNFIDPQDPFGSRTSRLHLPRRWDNLLACRLFGLDENDERPTDEQLELFHSLFTVNEPENLPAEWAPLRAQLRLVVSDHPDADRMDQRRQDVLDAVTLIAMSSNSGDQDSDEPQRPEVDLLQTAHLLLRRAFLGELKESLAELEHLLPLMRDSGMRLADDIEAALDRGSTWQATPEGPMGRAVFGFAVTGDPDDPSDRRLNAEILSGDPHAYTADLGSTTAAALTGSPRIVLGLSATAYLPGAPTNHVYGQVIAHYPDSTDTGTGQLTVTNASTNDRDTNRGITVSGAARNRKRQLLDSIGAGLWQQHLEPRLEALRQHHDPARQARARVLLVTNSYEQAIDLTRGLINGGAQRSRIAVAIPAAGNHHLQIPDDVLALPATRLQTFPETGRDVLISPFARVARGLNIVVDRYSALDSIWVCVRPLKLIDEPAALVAHTGARARRNRSQSTDPRQELDARHQIAANHLETINRSNPAFGRLPANVRTAIFADILADLIQLAGRARRGGTDTTLHLVDNAFHRGGAAPGSDFPNLIRALHKEWSELGVLDQVTTLYGSTIDAVFAFAGLSDRNQ